MNIIGVMSGTSLDGIDLVYVNFQFTHTINYTIIQSITYPYNEYWINKLRNAHTLDQIGQLQINQEYTYYLAQQINQFILTLGNVQIDAVCSHGHTIIHKPNEGFTLQIGNLPILCELINKTVVCDFRTQDVKLGGQGAPLVPLGDKLLFQKYYYRINLGGFSNISYEINGQTFAFDICPVNTVLNRLAYPKEFDENGNLSKQGTINQKLLNQLNALDFYKKEPPKSLGVEWVYEIILPILNSYDICQQDKLRTFVEHIAIQIGNVISEKEKQVLFTGGGVWNTFLIERIQEYIKNVQIVDKQTSDFKEALIFGLLGVLRLRGEINVLSSVTGAKHDHSSGQIYMIQNI